MAKVRVYELARELDIESKELVEKLIEGGMNIKNHMAALDEKAVLMAKQVVAGAGAVSVIVEEKRVKSTVIRRRRKRVKAEPEPKVSVPQVDEEEIAKTEDLTPQPSVEDRKAEEDEVEPVALPETEKPVKKAMETDVAEEVSPPDTETREVLKEVEVLPPEETKEEADVSSSMETLEKEKPDVSDEQTKKTRLKKAKLKKSETAAKIIKKADGILTDLLKKQADRKAEKKTKPVRTFKPSTAGTSSKEISGTPKEEFAGKKKPARKRKEKKKTEKEVVESRRGSRRSKLEVYEKKDLYDQARPLRRKPKKGAKRAKETPRKAKQTEITVPKAIKRRLKVPELVTVSELAKAMGFKAAELIKKLLAIGVIVNINQSIDFETSCILADDFGYELVLDTFEEEQIMLEDEEPFGDLEPRPPVVTIMGHVDHGKTSLLDYIRKSNILGGEFGGITQHIGAYYVEGKGGADIVFLDTPGHEAFTSMRARGARVTDIIVLVVAADDGVMPQTKEAINHARAAEIPIIVAVNKIDKLDTDPEKVKRELAELDLVPEEWGGETLYGNVSAKTGDGVDDLLGLILLQAEILELKADPNKYARGSVIDAELDKSRGPIATILIKNGTLKNGEYFVCGEHYGRVRAMVNHRGKKMESAGPSMPVEIYGISGVPLAGDKFAVVKDERMAKQVAEHRKLSVETQVSKKGVMSLDDLFERIKEEDIKELRIVLKADVQGSLEALIESLAKQNTEEVKIKVIHGATGAISESDLMLAAASDAIVIGFNVRANQRVLDLSERENVDIRYYDVIYNVIKEIRLAMAGLLDPVYEENVIGHADVKEIFHVPKIGSVAGCLVSDGRVERKANVRLLRDSVVVFDGKLISLRRFKDDVKEVQSGYECGIGLENFNDLKPGDVLEIYQVKEIAPEL
jgi:translation initiation factor IF-2